MLNEISSSERGLINDWFVSLTFRAILIINYISDKNWKARAKGNYTVKKIVIITLLHLTNKIN